MKKFSWILFLISLSAFAMPSSKANMDCPHGEDEIVARVVSIKIESRVKSGEAVAQIRYRSTLIAPAGKILWTTSRYPVCEGVRKSNNSSALFSLLSLSASTGAQKSIGLCLGPRPCIASVKQVTH